MDDELLVFGSEDCLGWVETRGALNKLEEDPEFQLAINHLDPIEHEETFRERGLVVCPSIVYKDEIIAVGPPKPGSIKQKIEQLHSDQ